MSNQLFIYKPFRYENTWPEAVGRLWPYLDFPTPSSVLSHSFIRTFPFLYLDFSTPTSPRARLVSFLIQVNKKWIWKQSVKQNEHLQPVIYLQIVQVREHLIGGCRKTLTVPRLSHSLICTFPLLHKNFPIPLSGLSHPFITQGQAG